MRSGLVWAAGCSADACVDLGCRGLPATVMPVVGQSGKPRISVRSSAFPSHLACPICSKGSDVADCALQEMPDYFPQLLAWLDAFPSKQIMLLQVGGPAGSRAWEQRMISAV